MEQGISKRDAMMKSREIIIDFYTVCDRLTRRGQTPFIAIINELDQEKLLNSNSHKDGRKKDLSEDDSSGG
jgi:hypothetical protein